MPRDSTLLKSSTEAAKTVKPYLDAGQGEIVFWQMAILPGITAHPTPGHLLVIAAMWRSKGRRHQVLGDIVHAASVQFPN